KTGAVDVHAGGLQVRRQRLAVRVGGDHDRALSGQHGWRQERADGIDQEPIVLIELDDVVTAGEGNRRGVVLVYVHLSSSIVVRRRDYGERTNGVGLVLAIRPKTICVTARFRASRVAFADPVEVCVYSRKTHSGRDRRGRSHRSNRCARLERATAAWRPGPRPGVDAN